MSTRSVVSAAIWLAVCAGLQGRGIPIKWYPYKVEDLVAMEGVESYANGINNLGQVVGFTLDSNYLGHAFRYTDGIGVEYLGSLCEGGGSGANAINELGQVVGASGDPYCKAQAYRHTDGIGMVGLGWLSNGWPTGASGINNWGVVVGTANFYYEYFRAWRYTDAKGMEELPVGNAVASDVNDAGQVVGTINGQGQSWAYRYSDGEGAVILKMPGDGLGGRGYAINGRGQVTGGYGNGYVFRYTDGIGSERIGTGIGYGINNLGQVVGWFSKGAFLYTDGVGQQSLNDLIDPAAGWSLTDAYDINDKGQIVGVGYCNGLRHAYRLTPSAHKKILPPTVSGPPKKRGP